MKFSLKIFFGNFFYFTSTISSLQTNWIFKEQLTRLTSHRYNINMFVESGQYPTRLLFSYILIQHRFSTLLQSPMNKNIRKLFLHSIIQTLDNSFQFWKKLRHRSATVIKIWFPLSIYVCLLIRNLFPKNPIYSPMKQKHLYLWIEYKSTFYYYHNYLWIITFFSRIPLILELKKCFNEKNRNALNLVDLL